MQDAIGSSTANSDDVYLFKLSLFSRLAALKPIQDNAALDLSNLFSKVKNWLSQQLAQIEQPQIRLDLIVDTLGYLSLKSKFKEAMLEADFASFTNQITSLVISKSEGVQENTIKLNGIYQSFIFFVLNLVRDTEFEKLPSYSLAKWEECKKLDISYFELKELEKSLGKQSVEG